MSFDKLPVVTFKFCLSEGLFGWGTWQLRRGSSWSWVWFYGLFFNVGMNEWILFHFACFALPYLACIVRGSWWSRRVKKVRKCLDFTWLKLSYRPTEYMSFLWGLGTFGSLCKGMTDDMELDNWYWICKDGSFIYVKQKRNCWMEDPYIN